MWIGPDETVGDLHAFVDRDEHGLPRTLSVWQPTDEERAAIAAGANVALRVTGAHPPVELYVSDEQGSGEDAPELRARLEEWRRGVTT